MVGVDDQVAGVAEDSGSVALSVPARGQFIRLARLVGAGLANELGFDLDALDDVRLAIGEVCGLAVQAGASQIHLSYRLAGSQLTVTGEAPLAAPGTTDDEQVRLVEHILGVAARHHQVQHRDGELSFQLTFGHGT